MSMPEAAIDQDDGPVFSQNQIRLSGEFSVVKAVPKPECMEAAPDQHFGSGVSASDACHHPAAGLFVDNVSHQNIAF